MVKKLCLTLALLSIVSSDCLDSCPAHKLGDGKCDDECNTYECSFDGSDCLTYCECEVSLLGDGVCNQECYYERCSWDYGDCANECFATSCDLSQLGDGTCNQECNSLACEHDKGDCGDEKSVEENYALGERSSNLSAIQYRHSSRLLRSTSNDPYIAIYIIIPIMIVISALGIGLRIYRIRAYRRAMARAPAISGVTIIPPVAPQVVQYGAPNQGIQMQPQPVYGPMMIPNQQYQMQPQPVYGSVPVNGPMFIPNQQYQMQPQPVYGGMPSHGPGAMDNHGPAYPNQAYTNPAYGNMQGYAEKPVSDSTIMA